MAMFDWLPKGISLKSPSCAVKIPVFAVSEFLVFRVTHPYQTTILLQQDLRFNRGKGSYLGTLM